MAQMHQAELRGIRWDFTFKSWLAWWGDDLDRRGVGRDQLTMQRRWDQGPYAPWNVIKGTPKDNARTRSYMRRRDHPVICAVKAKDCEEYLELEDGSPDLGYSTSYKMYGIG